MRQIYIIYLTRVELDEISQVLQRALCLYTAHVSVTQCSQVVVLNYERELVRLHAPHHVTIELHVQRCASDAEL